MNLNNYIKSVLSGVKTWALSTFANKRDFDELNSRMYYSEQVEKFFFKNTQISPMDSYGNYVNMSFLEKQCDDISVGDTLKVVWDGTEYECKVFKYDDALAIGNKSIMGTIMGESFADTGEPFAIAIWDGYSVEFYYTDMVSESHVVSISGMVEKVHHIDSKYLPSMDYVSYNEEQNLTVDQMALARWNIGAGTSDFDGNYNSLTNKPTIKQDVVQYSVTQSLSDTNKSKARSNIGAVSENDVTTLIGNAIDSINQDILDLNGLVGNEKVSIQISNAINEAMSDVGESTGENGAEIFNDYDHNIATGAFSHAEGTCTKAVGAFSHTEGKYTEANGKNSHAEGYATVAEGDYSHTEGIETTAYGEGAHAEGYSFAISPTITESSTNDEIASAWSAASAQFTLAKGQGSHAEGNGNLSLGTNAHAEGRRTVAIGAASHAEGYQTIARGDDSHIEGVSDKVLPSTITSESTNDDILAQWKSTKFSMAAGYGSHVEGRSNLALNIAAHAEGHHTVAQGSRSHSEGEGTRAMSNNQHVQGKYNTEDANNVYAHIVGNGSSESSRSNAHTVDWDGNAWFAGDVYVGSTSGTNKDDGSKKLATEDLVSVKQDKLTFDETPTDGSTNPVMSGGVVSYAVPQTRTINGKALSANISLTASDVGADASGAASTALNNAKTYTNQEIASVKSLVSTTYETQSSASTKLAEAKAYTDTAVADLADADHNHDDRYFTESKLNSVLGSYETKDDASDKLATAKSYTDTKVSGLVSSSTVDSKISAHNTASGAHSDIRAALTPAGIGLKTETWTFTLEDGSTVTKAVYVG